MANRSVSTAQVRQPDRLDPEPARSAPGGVVRLAEAAATYEVGLVTGADAFADLREAWGELFRRADSATYFTSFEWCWTWWRWFGAAAGARPALVTVLRQGRLVAVLPLSVTRSGPFVAAGLIAGGTGQYGDALIDPGCAGPQIEAAVADGLALCGADTVLCDNVRAGSALERCLARWPGQSAGHMRSYEVRLDGNFAAYMELRSASLRKNLRRRRKRLGEAVGEVGYEVVTDAAAIEDAVRETVELKRHWLAGQGLHGRLLADDRVADWLTEVALGAEGSGNLHLSVLRAGGRIAATQLGLFAHGRLVGYLAAFDPDLARYSVGKLHLADHLADIAGCGVDLDLMPPADDYKREWGTPGPSVATHMVALTPRGRLVMALAGPRMRQRMKAAYLAVPAPFRAGAARHALALLGRARSLVSGRPHSSPSPRTSEDDPK
jgi:CelD/BcsL family acetyltransferase involved in cellulose biosynthesis